MRSVFNFLGTTVIPKRVENKSYAKLRGGGGGGAKKVYYGRCPSVEWKTGAQ